MRNQIEKAINSTLSYVNQENKNAVMGVMNNLSLDDLERVELNLGYDFQGCLGNIASNIYGDLDKGTEELIKIYQKYVDDLEAEDREI